jgi:autophagy-related protein 2
MNFLILDEANIVLRHTIIYSISGFEKIDKYLNDIWMPNVKRYQLPGILASLTPVHSSVNIGGGFKDLIVVLIHEYKKDGRIVRSISKGAAAFAKTTGTELVKLGAKVAIGVQTVLQRAEDYLGPDPKHLHPIIPTRSATTMKKNGNKSLSTPINRMMFSRA